MHIYLHYSLFVRKYVCMCVCVCAAQCHINSFKTQRACSVKIAAAAAVAAVRHKGCTASKRCGGAERRGEWITRTMSVKRVAYQQQLSQLLNIYNNRVFIAVAM